MNATSYSEFRTAVGPQGADDKMDQIRELLIGEYQRQAEARFGLVEARVRELEMAIHRRLDVIEGQMQQLATRADADHRATLDELARGIADLGEHVRRIR